ncbi:DAPG hydrolase family protein [Rhizobium lusitanum]|uniref:DAPG hydrolase PhiG domain-containing protein n=1 Tax=Rhizobium lusitanum TaxID=293958 RepID=A0A7X0ITT3_9HYPH|nr:hypothetical protein [Rhizobium lusitanum]MBB6486890.1 hypothetical protein [Rhizobium lusitanum]
MEIDLEVALPKALLRSHPIPLEMGVERLASGTLVVACRTVMHGCTGQMFDWWFKYFETEEHLLWWHPNDHKRHFGWDENWKKGKNYIGATIRAAESLGEIPPVVATIKFLEPNDYFGQVALTEALDRRDVSSVVYAGIGFGDRVVLDPAGVPITGRMMHVTRDTPDGLVLRSRFALGLDAAQTGHEVPDEIGLGLMRHCHSEFSYLAKVLPSLYYGDTANQRPADNW